MTPPELRENPLRSLVYAVIAGRFTIARSPLTAVLTILTVAAASSLVIGLEIASRSVREELGKTSRALLGSAEIEIVASKRGIPEELVARVAAVPGVFEASPVISENLRIEDAAAQNLGLNVLGIDLLARRQTRDLAVTRERVRVRDPLRLLARPTSIIVAASLAARIGAREGSTLRVRSPVGHHELVVEGLIEPGGLGDAFGGQIAVMDVYALQALLDARGFVDKIEVTVEEGREAESLVAAIQQVVAGRANARLAVERDTWVGSLLRLIATAARAIAGVSVGISAFIVYTATMQAIERRTREFALMRCAGMGPRGVRILVAGDVLTLSGIGIALGLLGGQWGAPLVLSGFSGLSEYLTQVEITDAGVSATVVGVGIGAWLLIAVLASLRPARRAGEVPPLALLAESELGPSGPPMGRRRWWICAGAAAAILVVPLARGRLPAALLLAVVAGTGIGAVAAGSLPFLHALGALLRRRPRSRARIAWIAGTLAPGHDSSAGAQTATLAAVVCAAISIVTVLESLITSMDESIAGRYQGAVAVYPSDLQAGALQGSLLAPTIETIATTPGVDDVVVYHNATASMRGRQVQIFAFTARALFERGHLFTDDATPGELRDALDRGEVAITHTFRHATGIATGDTVVLDTPSGERSFRVAGLVRLYGLSGSVLMDLRTFDAHFRRDGADFLALWSARDRQPLLDEISRRTAEQQPLFFVDGETLRRFARTQSLRFRGMLNSLGALALVFSGLGMLGLTATRVASSRGVLALLGSVGATPNEIRLLLASESSGLAATGILAGAVLGAVCGPLATDVLGEAVGWVLVPQLPLIEVALVCAAAFALTVAVSVTPALLVGWRTSQASPLIT